MFQEVNHLLTVLLESMAATQTATLTRRGVLPPDALEHRLITKVLQPERDEYRAIQSRIALMTFEIERIKKEISSLESVASSQGCAIDYYHDQLDAEAEKLKGTVAEDDMEVLLAQKMTTLKEKFLEQALS